MELWFLDKEDRLIQERQAIDELFHRVDWLGGLSWKIDEELHLEAILNIDKNEYHIVLSYPFLYPDTPAWIKPKNPKEGNWSGHQYGTGGTLCLEWGHDNWHPDITGAQLIESAYKLLNKEKPHNKEVEQSVQSRHNLTTGQKLRGEFGRFYVSSLFKKYIQNLHSISSGKIYTTFCFNKDYFKIYVLEVKSDTFETWNDNSIPAGVKEHICQNNLSEGLFFKLEIDDKLIFQLKTLGDLKILLKENNINYSFLESAEKKKIKSGMKTILLINKNNEPYLYVYFKNKLEEKIIRLTSVFSENKTINERISSEYDLLKEKTIGIVGLGSVGSKIAVSLARTGISSFYLVDEDVFLPENICRNYLNWRNVGEHKVDAISYELELINPGVDIKKSKINITEQESSSVLNNILNRLGKCDIIIDASGSQKVFNVLASVSKRYSKPLVWGEVYEGGIGGLIARSRPGIDPEPLVMKWAYLNTVSSAPKFKSRSINNYESEDDSGNIISASDAQVGIIAYKIADFVIDTLVKQEKSDYPFSMYLLGLKKSWIFKAPFDTYPIKIQDPQKDVKEKKKKSMTEDHKKFILKAIKNKKDENNTSKKN